ncbi:hypothetical protein FQN54_008640 [Arachnomyces sp. PD_36]|nr:hypothetical protein FQN54_008640 [Arachnomyces sp. PD_36]
MFNNALRKLSGANLEVFKFGIYILFPIGWMYYFGTNLEERFAVPGFWPKAEHSHKIPVDREEIDKELARMKKERAFRREREVEGVKAAEGAGQ